MIRLTEQQLHQLIKEAATQYINEADRHNKLWFDISEASDKCKEIIFRTQYAGRIFDFKNSDLDKMDDYKILKGQLIEAMENYFNAAKHMLSFLASITENQSAKDESLKYLQATFQPTWK